MTSGNPVLMNITRHIDSARAYRNEDAVGRAMRELKIPREEMFVSRCKSNSGFQYQTKNEII